MFYKLAVPTVVHRTEWKKSEVKCFKTNVAYTQLLVLSKTTIWLNYLACWPTLVSSERKEVEANKFVAEYNTQFGALK